MMISALPGLNRWRGVVSRLAAMQVDAAILPALTVAGSYLHPTLEALRSRELSLAEPPEKVEGAAAGRPRAG
jgi:hypothetical protein